MQITNRENLPDALVRAAEAWARTEAPAERRVSVTQLIGPPRILQLQREHWPEIEDDVADRVWAIFGQAVHAVLEAGADGWQEYHVGEQIDGWTLTGRFDYLSAGGTLRDWKVTSVYKHLSGSTDEWERQLNLYAWLAKREFLDVQRLEVVMIFRDWRASEAQSRADYPPPVLTVELPLWPDEKTEAYVRERLAHHEKDHPPCSDEERWSQADSWAVVKPGNKRASKVCASEEEAAEWIDGRDGFEIEHRPGRDVRCERYCPVRAFCDHGRRAMEAAG